MEEFVFAFIVLFCIPDANQCYRIEPIADTPAQCEMLREDFLEIKLPNQRYYVGACEEIEVDHD